MGWPRVGIRVSDVSMRIASSSDRPEGLLHFGQSIVVGLSSTSMVPGTVQAAGVHQTMARLSDLPRAL